ncbi:MAG: sigma-70 family RNA polymerase sigma factor [Synoicihabitans sp.]
MKNVDVLTELETTPDEDLVLACLGGDREAFGQIVERYQRLLCSLAYSAVGNLSESEDIAQEAFITAWQKMSDLKDPAKLRPWLCGIVRFKASRSRRKDAREPVRGADELDALNEQSDDEPSVPDTTIREEEQAILWHALEQIPEKYREPLVLYYREHQSIEHVAVELDMKEDAVKQRLSRGRKMLKEQAMSFVEGALSRSTPGKLFTVGVLSALATISPPAKAAGIGAAAAAVGKGAGGIAKTTLFAAILASVSGLVSSVMALRMNLNQSRTKRERRHVVVTTISLVGSFWAFIGLLFLLRTVALGRLESAESILSGIQFLVIGFSVGWSWLFFRCVRKQAELREQERERHPERFLDPRFKKGSKTAEYKSRTTFCGVPLVHVRFGMQEKGDKPVFGWIAIGDRAVGLLFAWGGLAVGFCAVGAVSVGVLSFGGIGIGILAAGAICYGWWAMGAVSMGMHALGSLFASAWETAQGGFMVMSQYVATGQLAVAPHANDTIAHLTLYNPDAGRNWLIFCVVVVVLTLLPISLYAKAVKKRFKDEPIPFKD